MSIDWRSTAICEFQTSRLFLSCAQFSRALLEPIIWPCLFLTGIPSSSCRKAVYNGFSCELCGVVAASYSSGAHVFIRLSLQYVWAAIRTVRASGLVYVCSYHVWCGFDSFSRAVQLVLVERVIRCRFYIAYRCKHIPAVISVKYIQYYDNMLVLYSVNSHSYL